MLTATREQTLVLEETAGFSAIDPSRLSLAGPWVAETSPKVLLVEDDHNIAFSLTLRLKGEGYEVLAALNASEGLSRTADEAQLPDVEEPTAAQALELRRVCL